MAGYGFAVAGGHLFIWLLMRTLWESVRETGVTKQKPHREEHREFPMMLGILERSLYVAAWQFGKPEFMGVWLALKVAGQWKAWGEDIVGRDRIILGRAIFNVFLIGNGLSISYGVVGALIIDWWGKGLKLPLTVVPLMLVIVNVVFWLWAKWHLARRHRFISN